MLLLTSIFVTVLLPYVNSAPSTSTSTTVPAPTVGPTKEVGKLPALGYVLTIEAQLNIVLTSPIPQMEYVERLCL